MSQQPIFITGNPNKAKHYGKLLGIKFAHRALDLIEIQSANSEEIIEHKVRQAYDIVKRPVFVDDYSFVLDDLNGLPGPFIKYFIEADDGLEKVCRMADGLKSRNATTRGYFAYFDGSNVTIIHGGVTGKVAKHPKGDLKHAYGAAPIFCADGYGGRTNAELTEVEYENLYRQSRNVDSIKEFLQNR